MKKAVILLSGGMDSATCVAIAKSSGYECYAISFDYGQKQIAELNAAKKLASRYASQHEIIDLKCLGKIARSALTQDNINIPDHSKLGEIPITYVPARNTVLLSIALSYAESIQADAIYIGASAIDYSGYPDCRPEYFEKFQALSDYATKAGVEGNNIKIVTPLINLSKAETIKLGLELGIDYKDTITCYRANEHGEACGTCSSCVLRKKGFEDLGVEDQTVYVKVND